MDYLFRWMQLRFLSGHQLSLFSLKSLEAPNPAQASLPTPAASAPPDHAVILSEAKDLGISAPAHASDSPSAPGNTVPDIYGLHEPTATHGAEAEQLNDRRPPQQGIAGEPQAQSFGNQISRDLTATSGLSNPYSLIPNPSSIEDRGLYHAASAMKSMYDMGDAPSCSTCGAIMTRNGSCYRCMECGSTSGCS
jgi:ribonucleoside-diphosphate reductase alpha chain